MRTLDDLTDRERLALAERNNINQRLQFSSLEGIREGAQGNLNRDWKQGENKLDRASALERSGIRAAGKADESRASAMNMINALNTFKTGANQYTAGGGVI